MDCHTKLFVSMTCAISAPYVPAPLFLTVVISSKHNIVTKNVALTFRNVRGCCHTWFIAANSSHASQPSHRLVRRSQLHYIYSKKSIKSHRVLFKSNSSLQTKRHTFLEQFYNSKQAEHWRNQRGQGVRLPWISQNIWPVLITLRIIIFHLEIEYHTANLHVYMS